MSGPMMDFVVDCCARANWVGYGRGYELVCEFLDSHHARMLSNDDLRDFIARKIQADIDVKMPERCSADELASMHAGTTEEKLSLLCEFIDRMNLNQSVMGFLEDMVESHQSDW